MARALTEPPLLGGLGGGGRRWEEVGVSRGDTLCGDRGAARAVLWGHNRRYEDLAGAALGQHYPVSRVPPCIIAPSHSHLPPHQPLDTLLFIISLAVEAAFYSCFSQLQ